MTNPKESDWKQYSSIVEELRERYLKEKNQGFINMLSDPDKNATENFWDTLEKMKEETKTLELCLGKHSRSSMFIQMLAMCTHGMLTNEDLANFSEELQDSLKKCLK